jgi:hypothetical protein
VKSLDPVFAHSARGSTRGTLAAAVTLACFSMPTLAANGGVADDQWLRTLDLLNPYAAVGYAYDSNLFRVDDAVPTAAGRSDRIATLSAGFDTELKYGLQRIELGATVNHNLFDTYDYLDYTGGTANAIWHWSLGDVSTGTAGYQYKRTLRDFANQLAIRKTKDIKTEHRLNGTGDIDLPGQWRLGLRADVADIGFSNTKALDLLHTMAGARLNFISKSGNLIGFDAQFAAGDYDSNPNADFDEYDVGPTLEWHLTPRTLIDAKIGYSSRNYKTSGRADYDDITGRMTLRMADDGRGKMIATLWRDISNLGDESADFAVINGLKVEPSWTLPNGMDLRLNASYEKRDFQEELAGLVRKDDVYTGGVFLDWNVTRNIMLTFGVDAQQRSSTRELQDFDFARVQLQVTGTL